MLADIASLSVIDVSARKVRRREKSHLKTGRDPCEGHQQIRLDMRDYTVLVAVEKVMTDSKLKN
jgi:hypothetical protein